MKTVYHPSLPLSRDVADDDVAKWVELGWRKTKPSQGREDDSAKSGAKPAKG